MVFKLVLKWDDFMGFIGSSTREEIDYDYWVWEGLFLSSLQIGATSSSLISASE